MPIYANNVFTCIVYSVIDGVDEANRRASDPPGTGIGHGYDFTRYMRYNEVVNTYVINKYDNLYTSIMEYICIYTKE